MILLKREENVQTTIVTRTASFSTPTTIWWVRGLPGPYLALNLYLRHSSNAWTRKFFTSGVLYLRTDYAPSYSASCRQLPFAIRRPTSFKTLADARARITEQFLDEYFLLLWARWLMPGAALRGNPYAATFQRLLDTNEPLLVRLVELRWRYKV